MTVTPIRADLRGLQWRAHTSMPADRQQRIEWAIEQQLNLAHDYQEPSLGDVLLVFAPDAAVCGALLDELIELSAEVNDAQLNGPTRRWHAAVDEYRAALTRVAVLVRGGVS